jgi:DNA primase
MSIPDELVEEVRQRADLVEIVSEYTRLKRSGKTFRGPCPLHGGNGPNFSVDPSKGLYKCFVCGEGGTVFTFLQRHLGLSFPDAVRMVAERVGVVIPDPREQHREADPNDRFYEINAFAADWFAAQLAGTDGAAARAYLERRGISPPVAERFGLGWAPERWDALRDAARGHRIDEDDLLALGLTKISERSGGRYDAFRGRVIFPIRDLGGRVVAFGGRVIGDEVPKYLNSAETPVYHKSDVLYGLNWSRGAIRKEETALVVEGYMDFVALAAHGVENVVAPLGTALTERQAALLARYARRVVLLYDSDMAGLRATFRAGDELLRAGVEVLVATLPDGEDPDSLVRREGAAALRRYIDDAVDVFDRKLGLLERRGLFGSIAGVRRAIDALLPTVRAASDEVIRGVYLSRVAEKTGVPRETLERETSALERTDRADRTKQQQRPGVRPDGRRPPPGRPDPREPVPQSRGIGPERMLLLLLLRDESYVERAAQEVSADDFRDPVYRAIYDGLMHMEGGRDPDGRWLEAFEPEVLPTVEALRGDPEGAHFALPEEVFTANVRRILARPFEERVTSLNEALESETDPDRQREILAQKGALLDEMRARGFRIRAGTLRSSGR